MIKRVTLSVQVDVDLELLAEQFAELDDDAQARVLCLVAAKLGDGAERQAFFIGEHLRTCECSTADGRAFVRAIAASVEIG